MTRIRNRRRTGGLGAAARLPCDATGKARYPTEGAARRALYGLRVRRADRGRVHLYRCTVCRDWHVGH